MVKAAIGATRCLALIFQVLEIGMSDMRLPRSGCGLIMPSVAVRTHGRVGESYAGSDMASSMGTLEGIPGEATNGSSAELLRNLSVLNEAVCLEPTEPSQVEGAYVGTFPLKAEKFY
jgi:hypothetical protein